MGIHLKKTLVRKVWIKLGLLLLIYPEHEKIRHGTKNLENLTWVVVGTSRMPLTPITTQTTKEELISTGKSFLQPPKLVEAANT